MSKFSTCKIADIAEKIAMGPFGSNIKVATFVDSGVPIISGVHLRGFYLDEHPGYNYITEIHAQNLKNSTVYPEDIIFTHAGNVGQVAMIPQNCRFPYYMISQRQFYLRCNKTKVLPQFVVYYLHSHEGQGKLLANVSQVGVPSIAQPSSFLKTIEIPLPSISEQQKLVYILDSINAKIELNAQINQNLEAQAQAIFKSWFVDFEPFQDGKFIDSELGPIPEGWRVVSLEDMAVYNNEKLPASQAMLDTYISTENMLLNRGGIELASSVPSTGCVTVFAKDDVLLSNIRPYFRKIWYASLSGTCSTDVLCFRAKAKAEREYLFCVLNSESFFEYIMSGAKGTKMPRGDKRQIMSYRIVKPHQDILDNFSRTLKPLVDQQRRNTTESHRLAALRDTLLPKLMSGEIDVSDVEV